MQWFKHDSDAASDAKIKKLVMRYGADGYAIYFHCIELIAGNISERNITFELEHDAEIIADNLKIQGTSDTSPVDRVNQIMRYIVSLGLFEENNGHIFCYKMLKRLDSSMTSSPKMRKLITQAKACHDKVMINHDNIMQEENRIDEIRTEENRIDIEPDKPARSTFQKPTLQEITEYILSKQLVIKPSSFYEWYENTEWKDNKGNSVKNWKNKLINWNARELEKTPNSKPYKEPETQKIFTCSCGGVLEYGRCESCGKIYDGMGQEI